MTIKLMLDREALESLFPEGTEARVELRRAVLTDLVAKLVIKDVKHLEAGMEAQARGIATRVLQAEGFKVNEWDRNVLPPRTEQYIKDKVASAVGDLIFQTSVGVANARLEEIKATTENMISRREGAAQAEALRPVIRDEVRKVLKEGLGS